MTIRSERPPRSAHSSGEHPAVRAYRAKLDSVAEGAAKAKSKLDHELQQFLTDLRTPVPSEPPSQG
jgi:hypothetical protein